MKYIVGASIGGLFGLSVPLMIDTHEIDNKEVPRQEVPQHVEEEQPTYPSVNMQHLPDNVCRYLELKSDNLKDKAKECLSIDIPAVPAI